MKKEDYLNQAVGLPIDIIFIPEALSIEFKDKIKLQIAFYRTNKICKTSPTKFLKSSCQNNKIAFQPEELQFCTTVNYNKSTKTFLSKDINVQLAYQTDGQKQTLDSKVDLKDILIYQQSFNRSGLTINFKENIKLYFGVSVKLSLNKGNEEPEIKISPPKNARNKSEAGRGDKSQKKTPVKEKQKVVSFHMAEKENELVGVRTQNQEPPGKAQGFQRNDLLAGKNQIQNLNSPRNERVKQKNQEAQAWIKRYRQLEQRNRNSEEKLKQLTTKYQITNDDNTGMKNKIKSLQSQLESKNKEGCEMEKLFKRVSEQKNALLQNFSKNVEEDSMKKYALQIEKLSQEVKSLNETNCEYKLKIEQLKKFESQLRKSTLQIERMNQEIRSLKELNGQYKQRIEELKKTEVELKRNNSHGQKSYQEIQKIKEVSQEYRRKVEQFKKSQSQMRSKYQQSQKKSLQLLAQLQDARYNEEKMRSEHQKLSKRIEKLEQQINDKSLGGSKIVLEEDSKSKQEIVRLTKMIETKEEVIKGLKKEYQVKKVQQSEQLNALKKQNKDLKDEIDKLKDPKKDSGSLELKVQNQKLRKECTDAKREQKKMLAQKSEIESKNRVMQQEIIRLKQTIAKMLNVVQQNTSGDLYNAVSDCVS